MKLSQRIFVLLLAIGLLAGCNTSPKVPAQSLQHNNMYSTLWVQTSAEYKANALQTFRNAKMQLAAAKADTDWRAMLEQSGNATELPPAIVLDVDETVLDNSPFQAMMVKTNTSFNLPAWDNWIALAQAKAVPGAVDFINAALEQGIEVIYLTNRECSMRQGNDSTCPQVADTANNLRAVGITSVNDELVLLKSGQAGWGSEKQSRREYLADKYRVLMLFGDDFGDFLPNVKKNITHERRAELVDEYQHYWGTKWFALTNPTYGSWQGVLQGEKSDYLMDY